MLLVRSSGFHMACMKHNRSKIHSQLAIFGKAELGGPTGPKYASAAVLVCLWLFYIVMASLQSYEYIEGF